jgi:hypothetical protein
MFINFTYPSVINHGNGKFLIDDCPIKAVKKNWDFTLKPSCVRSIYIIVISFTGWWFQPF